MLPEYGSWKKGSDVFGEGRLTYSESRLPKEKEGE